MTIENPDDAGLPVDPSDPTDPHSIEMITAALRADAAEVDTLARVLTATLGDALPPGLVQIERDRSLADRLARREGTPVAITVTTSDLQLRLSHGRARGGPIRAERHKIVRGVVISRDEIGVEEWIATLAAVLRDVAARNAAARDALSRLLER